MNPTPVLTLLGLTTLLPCMPALTCHKGSIESMMTVSELPLEWTSGKTSCETGEGCQDTLILLENGPQVNVLVVKDCTMAEDQEAQITRHRAGPGLSITSYTHVCRNTDFCNSMLSTEVLGTLSIPTVAGPQRCPLCLSSSGCDNVSEQACPPGHSHCYSGILKFRSGEIITNLRVQGCMSQPGCNLLNGTDKIGPVFVSEDCRSLTGPQAQDCHSGTIETLRNVSDLHLRWTMGWKSCEMGEGCYEDAMLIENGQQVNLFVTKGCTMAENEKAEVIRHRAGPGISITSYTHVCRHVDFCNDLATTEPLWTPPPDTVPGTQRCPLCISTIDCKDSQEHVCPSGQNHCYSGILRLRGGGIATNLKVKGCVPQSGCNLVGGSMKIGPVDVSENCNPVIGPQARECKSGQIEGVWPVSMLPLQWTTGWETCKMGQGCLETAVLITNGPQVSMIVTKGCTSKEEQEVQITHQRRGPGLSVTSYTHVCHYGDFCNDLSTSDMFWIPSSVTAPGTQRCPLCISQSRCLENLPEQVCPVGQTHCYSGVLSLSGGDISTKLHVQGCMPQPGCNLFNGTKEIGPVHVSEDCGPQLAVKALKCQRGTFETIRNTSALPLQWKVAQTTCKAGEGCQDTLIMIENGHQVSLALTKGCTTASDHQTSITEHRTGPGISVVSYTRVCRHEDYCNDLSSTAPLWTPPPVTVPGTVSCSFCLSIIGCENKPEQVCPADHTHCYSGVVRLRGGDIATKLYVQGCMPQPGCNLFNGTQEIGPVHVSEDCNPQLDTLTCYKGVMVKFGSGLAKNPVTWTSVGEQVCRAGELCQETLLMIDVGQKSLLVGSKGCATPTRSEDNIGLTLHSLPPGMIVASYYRFCSDSDLCNRAHSSSELLDSLPYSSMPTKGHVQCPVCLQFSGSCTNNTSTVTCAQGTIHCYSGNIDLQGGGLSGPISIQGCMASPSKFLLNNNKTIGIFSVKEKLQGDRGSSNPARPKGDAPSSHVTSIVVLVMSLALLYGGLCLPS